jgi:hypothetical protein
VHLADNQQAPPVSDASAATPHGLRGLDLLLAAFAWLLFLGLGIFFAQRIAVTGPAGMSLPRAAFFILNAASLTGFEMTWASPGTMTRAHASLWLIGIALTACISLMIATGAMVRVSGLGWSRTRVTLAAFAFLACLWAIAFLAETAGGGASPASAWNAMMVATGTGLLSETPASGAAIVWCARFPIAALAAIGPLLLIDALRGRGSTQARTLATALPAAFLLAVALVLAAQALAGQALIPAATAAIDARGQGFTDHAAQLTPAARWTLVPVLLLGDAHGGIGGGLKAVTAAVLVIGMARLLRDRGVGRTFAIAAVWLAALVALFGVTFILLLHTSPQLRPDRAAILAAAACGNAGVSVDPVSAAGNDAYVLAAAMLLGRALPWLVLWWSAARGDEPLAIG